MVEINLGCALAAGPGHGPWYLTCSFVEIMFWAPWISQVQTTGLPSFFLTSQPVVNISPFLFLLATLIINPLSPNIHIQILQTGLDTFP